jgi:hypothetical protein
MYCCLGASSAADALVHHRETIVRKRRVIHRAQQENRRRVETSATASCYAQHRPHPEGREYCEPDRLIAGYTPAQRRPKTARLRFLTDRRRRNRPRRWRLPLDAASNSRSCPKGPALPGRNPSNAGDADAKHRMLLRVLLGDFEPHGLFADKPTADCRLVELGLKVKKRRTPSTSSCSTSEARDG